MVAASLTSCRACAKGKLSRKAVELLNQAKERGLSLDSYIYTATIDGKYDVRIVRLAPISLH